MKLKNIIIILALLVFAVLGCMLGSFGSGISVPINGQNVLFKSFIPGISVPGEIVAWIGPTGSGFPIYNTFFTMLIVDAVIIVLALLGRAGTDLIKNKPTTFLGNAWESYVNYLYNNYMVPTLGARAKAVVPVALTAFTFILVSGMFELVPGHEAVGVVEDAKVLGKKGYCYVQTAPGGAAFLTGVQVVDDATKECPAAPKAEIGSPLALAAATDVAAAPASAEGDGSKGVLVAPFLRRPTSDLSTTLALALIAFIFIEIQGFRANGRHYLDRFFNFKAVRDMGKGMMTGLVNMIGFGVGFLELLSEFIRIISFSFRLFGNMFAGTILVFVMGFLMPFVVPTLFMSLEFAVAVIQAFVFMMLIVVFTSLAVAHTEH